MPQISPDDAAGAALLGITTIPTAIGPIPRLPDNSSGPERIAAINKLIEAHNAMFEGGLFEALLTNMFLNEYGMTGATVLDEVAATTQSITTSWTNITNWAGTFDCGGGTLLFFIEFTWFASAAAAADFRLQIDGVNYPSDTGFSVYTNETSSHKFTARTLIATHDAEEGVAIKLQGKKASGNLQFDAQDKIRITVLELPD